MTGKKSIVWKYFVKVDCNTAKCNLCTRLVKFNGNTTNLRNHLTRSHSIRFPVTPLKNSDTDADINEDDSEYVDNVSPIPPASTSSSSLSDTSSENNVRKSTIKN
jgi:hypothetical protein